MAGRTKITVGAAGGTSWELAQRPVDPRLRPYVRELMGYSERAAGVLRRREFPGPQAVVIFDLGPPIRIGDSGDVLTFPQGFVAGVDETYTVTEHDGLSSGIQCNLTPIGAHLFFGLPMSELAGRVVPFPDVVGRAHADLAHRLVDGHDWSAKLDLIERLLLSRLSVESPRSRMMSWAVGRIQVAGGVVDMKDLAHELGYSHKHTIDLFREHVGMPPKLFARLVRFDRLMSHLRTGGRGTWTDLALQFGYFDQSHLIREVRHFTGLTPTEARGTLIDFGALVPPEVNSVQDLPAPTP
jgi:AraC-like DNA-binding protein